MANQRADFNSVPFVSAPVAWSTGAGRLPFDMSFLEPAMRMKAPVAIDARIQFLGSVTATGGDTAAIDDRKLLSQIVFADRAGAYYDLPGSVHHVMEHGELGDRVLQLNAAITSGNTNAAFEVWWRILFDQPENGKWERSSDCGVELIRMLPKYGGQVTISTQLPTNHVVNSGNFLLHVKVVDERRRELKARRVRRMFPIGKVNDGYSVNGSLRAAYITSNLATTGYTSLATVLAGTFRSRTLDLASVDPKVIRDDYWLESPAMATTDPNLQTTPQALPLLVAKQRQHIGQLQDIGILDLEIAAVPTNGVIALDYIEDRDPQIATDWLGFNSIPDFGAAVLSRGMVKTTGSAAKKATDWDETLVKRLPMRVPAIAS